MAEAKQPSNWGWAADPPAGGTVRIRTTDTTSTFTATASSGYIFDHWTFTPYSGSSSAPGQWMPALQQQLSQNLTSNPHVSSRYTYDPEEHPEYNQAGIFATAHFVQSGPGPGPTPTSFEVEAFRFHPDILDAYVSLNGTTNQFDVTMDLAPGATVNLNFTTTNPTVVFTGWYRLAPSDPVATGGVLVSTNPYYTTTVRTDGANRYRANIASALVGVTADGMYDGAASINGENDGTRTVVRSVPKGVPCTVSAEPIVESSSLGPQIFLRWTMLSPETGEYVEVTRETEYTFTPDGTQASYRFAAEWAFASALTVTADPPDRGSVSRTPEPEAGDKWYNDSTLASPGVTLTATARRSATFLYWCYVSSLGRDIIISRNAVTTVNSGQDYIARFGPSHLLVNSDDRSIPVSLVHDPETNLLVADY